MLSFYFKLIMLQYLLLRLKHSNSMNIFRFWLSYMGKITKKFPYIYSFYTDIISNRLLPDICLVRRSNFVNITRIRGDTKQMQWKYFQFFYKLPGYNMRLFKPCKSIYYTLISEKSVTHYIQTSIYTHAVTTVP
jgi:hypothetical protein